MTAYYIAIRHHELLPAGGIMAFPSHVDGFLLADGSRFNIEDHPELYAGVGDAYCPREITVKRFPAWLHEALGFLRVPKSYLWKRIPNADYKEGMARLPDLRGLSIPL